jgi:hypothetical protein
VTNVRSEDWSVRPSFVPNGPTSPVALLIDETTLTQLAGIPPVAWQTPWSELTNIELVKFSSQMALFATVGDVRYCWRHRALSDFESMRAVVLEHGGTVTHRRRRVGVFVVVGAVVLASFAGGIAAWFTRGNANAQELTNAKSVNLTLNDLPSGWYTSSTSILSYLVPPGGQVYTSTTTTAPPKNSSFDKAAALFQSCLGVSNKKDRVYGAAGQVPDYQVSSSIFNSNSLGGIELATTAQYYRTTSMVRRDTVEISKSNFGPCFASSSAAIILSGYGLSTSAGNVAANWQPTTFLHEWSRGGVVALAVPGVTKKLQLVMAVMTNGHYEVTLSALVGSFAKAQSFLSNIVNTLLSRMTSSTSQVA